MTTKPKNNIIQETREIINEPSDIENVSLLGLNIDIFPTVFNPKNFFSSQWFAKELDTLIRGYGSFLEVGCGTGIISLFLAKENPNLKVFCTDVMEQAEKNTKHNAEKNNISNKVSVFCGDVFDGLPQDLKSDVIFWAMPFGFLDEKEVLEGRDVQVFDPGYRAIQKFFVDVRERINEHGHIYIGFSDVIGDTPLLEKIAKENKFELSLVVESYGTEKSKVDMKIYELKG